MGSLCDKYRPADWEEVYGQDTVVTAMMGVCKRRSAHTFLLCGPAGTGKTTLARIAAKNLKCAPSELIEIDAATNTGIDAMRRIQDVAQLRPFSDSARCVIVDECHRLSGQAMDSLLKVTEEPPDHLFWFFCTTNQSKLPKTLQTRCAKFELKTLSDSLLGQLYSDVLEAEKIKLPSDVGELIIRNSEGSARQMLANLEVCRDVKTKKEAAELLRVALDTNAVIELCRFLNMRGSWRKAMAIIEKLEDESPESVRIIVCNYFGKVLRNAKSDDEAVRCLGILEPFATPYNSSEGVAPLLRSIGQVLYA
jgi:DNA polymerase III gamma/tau subunit